MTYIKATVMRINHRSFRRRGITGRGHISHRLATERQLGLDLAAAQRAAMR
ncbi:MAG TPA: hypothetical protein H9881_15665 [Candidatus Stackebrandtia excrementipullorum]|nr:hypothetical protein [Candidatus Stackebrandtia excrementipullorum]